MTFQSESSQERGRPAALEGNPAAASQENEPSCVFYSLLWAPIRKETSQNKKHPLPTTKWKLRSPTGHTRVWSCGGEGEGEF